MRRDDHLFCVGAPLSRDGRLLPFRRSLVASAPTLRDSMPHRVIQSGSTPPLPAPGPQPRTSTRVYSPVCTFSPDNLARHMRDRPVGVLQYHAECLEDVGDDARLTAGLVELARTDSNRRAGRRASSLAAWLHSPAPRRAQATHPSRRQPRYERQVGARRLLRRGGMPGSAGSRWPCATRAGAEGQSGPAAGNRRRHGARTDRAAWGRPGHRRAGHRQLLPRRPLSQRRRVRRTLGHQPARGQQRPHRPAPTQPWRRPRPELRAAHHRHDPVAVLPEDQGLRRPPDRRGQDHPRDPPLPHALHRPRAPPRLTATMPATTPPASPA